MESCIISFHTLDYLSLSYMTICTPIASTEPDFYEVGALTTKFSWLNDQYYEKGLHGLWKEYQAPEDRQVLMILLERFIHHEHRDRLHAIDYLAEIIQKKKFTYLDTLFVATSNGKELDGSTAGLYSLKSALAEIGEDWKEDSLVPSLEMSFDKCGSCHRKNVVIFDDFIGSGKTIVNKVNKFRQEMRLRNISHLKIYIFSYVGMKFGIEHAEQELDIEIYCPLQLLKGITDYEDSNQDDLKDTILTMENKLGKKWKRLKLQDFSLGYKKSETLYQLYRSNCSNNVFPIFWWPKDISGMHRVTLFKRLR